MDQAENSLQKKDLGLDEWVEILKHLHNPKDFRNAALICYFSGQASLILKKQKAIEFSKQMTHGIPGMLQTIYRILPNQSIHGFYHKIVWMGDYWIEKVSLYSFGQYLKDIVTFENNKGELTLI